MMAFGLTMWTEWVPIQRSFCDALPAALRSVRVGRDLQNDCPVSAARDPGHQVKASGKGELCSLCNFAVESYDPTQKTAGFPMPRKPQPCTASLEAGPHFTQAPTSRPQPLSRVARAAPAQLAVQCFNAKTGPSTFRGSK